VEVHIRPLLPDEFNVDPASAELPALYRHLFRPDPVEEARFLVGRGTELAALADARARWEAGHSAAVIVTGERGSGKTSLVNCALQGALAGLPVSSGCSTPPRCARRSRRSWTWPIRPTSSASSAPPAA
jgi:hypothetical protein